MSSVYNLEPQPTGSVILHTTLGEILVELFAKQTPLTCRNFLQLGLDGYYDGTIFHRLVPGFILQGGDPTGTGRGGESIYDGGALADDLDPWPMDQRRGRNAGPMGSNFRDEFHSRLKFNRRGLLGMANDGTPDSNGSQFFFTLDKTEELTGKNTLFGRVAGDTIYNLAKIGESELIEGSDRPMYPIKVERFEVLVNPFEGITKKSRIAPRVQTRAPADKDRKKKKRGGRQLLSFGDEEGEEESPAFKKTKFDTRLIAGEASEEEEPAVAKPKKKPAAKVSKSAVVEEERPDETSSRGARSNATVGKEAKSQDRPEASVAPSESDQEPKSQPVPEPKPATKGNAREDSKRHNERPVERDRDRPRKEINYEELEKDVMVPDNSIRGRKRRPAGRKPGKEDADTVRMLKAFQSKLDKAPPEKEKEKDKETMTHRSSAPDDNDTAVTAADTAGEEAEPCDLHFITDCQSCTAWDRQEKADSDDEGWMSHALSFAAEKLGKDLRDRKKAEEELVVIDPREKARTLKDEARAKREARMGGSGRAWDQAADQARNAKMARAASLVGRGAK